jgi:hypothetical protein
LSRFFLLGVLSFLSQLIYANPFTFIRGPFPDSGYYLKLERLQQVGVTYTIQDMSGFAYFLLPFYDSTGSRNTDLSTLKHNLFDKDKSKGQPYKNFDFDAFIQNYPSVTAALWSQNELNQYRSLRNRKLTVFIDPNIQLLTQSLEEGYDGNLWDVENLPPTLHKRRTKILLLVNNRVEKVVELENTFGWYQNKSQISMNRTGLDFMYFKGEYFDLRKSLSTTGSGFYIHEIMSGKEHRLDSTQLLNYLNSIENQYNAISATSFISSNLFIIELVSERGDTATNPHIVVLNRGGEILTSFTVSDDSNGYYSGFKYLTQVGIVISDEANGFSGQFLSNQDLLKENLFKVSAIMAQTTPLAMSLLDNAYTLREIRSNEGVTIFDYSIQPNGGFLYIKDAQGNFGWVPTDAVDWSTIRFPNDEQLMDPEIQKHINEVSGQPIYTSFATPSGRLSSISATSSQVEPNDRNAYHPSFVLDGQPKTMWIEGANGNGAGESLTITFDTPITADSLDIRAGCFWNENYWRQNHRLKDYIIRIDGETIRGTFQDLYEIESVDLGGKKTFSEFEIEIVSTYPTSNWEDTAISDIWFKLEGNAVELSYGHLLPGQVNG